MNILLWIVFGGLAGWLATILLDTEESYGLLGNIVVGIIGAFIGGWIADSIGAGGAPGVDRPTGILSFIWAVIGAVILLAILNLLF